LAAHEHSGCNRSRRLVKQVTLLTRQGCHLCEDARSVVQAAAAVSDCVVTEIDVDGDPELRAEYGDMVPVVLINGVQHGYFRIDAGRLQRDLDR
jgi:glutaredoxin